MEEFVGAVILEYDGKEIECASISTDSTSGKRIVRTMNRARRAKGHSAGIPEHKLSVEVPIPTDGSEPDWLNISNAKLTVVGIEDGGPREVYTGCEVESMSSKYSVNDTAMRTLSFTALDRRVN